MHNRPDASQLILLARSELMSKLLPHLPEELRYEARMIASAMAIADREWHETDRLHAALPALLARALHPTARGLGSAMAETVEPDTGALLRLVMQIRAGEYNQQGTAQAALLTFLREFTRARLAVSNPKILGSIAPD
jgi:Domain of unknown function (DUF6285)